MQKTAPGVLFSTILIFVMLFVTNRQQQQRQSPLPQKADVSSTLVPGLSTLPLPQQQKEKSAAALANAGNLMTLRATDAIMAHHQLANTSCPFFVNDRTFHKFYHCYRKPGLFGVNGDTVIRNLSPHIIEELSLLDNNTDGEVVGFIDIGCNVGEELDVMVNTYTRCTRCRILSFEPNPEYIPGLRKIVAKALNATKGVAGFMQPEHVFIHNAAVMSDEDAGKPMYLIGKASGAHVSSKPVPGRPSVRIDAVSLRQQLEVSGVQRLGLFKIDSEGADNYLLLHNMHIINRFRPLMVNWEISGAWRTAPPLPNLGRNAKPSDLIAGLRQANYVTFLAAKVSTYNESNLIYIAVEEVQMAAVDNLVRWECGVAIRKGSKLLSKLVPIPMDKASAIYLHMGASARGSLRCLGSGRGSCFEAYRLD